MELIRADRKCAERTGNSTEKIGRAASRYGRARNRLDESGHGNARKCHKLKRYGSGTKRHE